MRTEPGHRVGLALLVDPSPYVCSSLKLCLRFPVHYCTLVDVAVDMVWIARSPVVIRQLVVVVETKNLIKN